MEKIEIMDIANYIINNFENVTPKKLQKLLYLTEAWFMADNFDLEGETMDVGLFNEQVYAWRHGPVYKNVYKKYKKFQWNVIIEDKKQISIPNLLEELLVEIKQLYDDKTANQLELITHQDNEWKEKFSEGNGSLVMSKIEIFREYSLKYEEE